MSSRFRLCELDSVLISWAENYMVEGLRGRSSHALYKKLELLLKYVLGRDVRLAGCSPNALVRYSTVERMLN